MSLLTQKTIREKFSISGTGIHTGLKVNMNVLPAPANTGILFKRTDLKVPHIESLIKAHPSPPNARSGIDQLR